MEGGYLYVVADFHLRALAWIMPRACRASNPQHSEKNRIQDTAPQNNGI